MNNPKNQFGPRDETGGTDQSSKSAGTELHGPLQGEEPGGEPPSAGLVVGVGASAGGLEAFSELLRNLPSNTGMAFSPGAAPRSAS